MILGGIGFEFRLLCFPRGLKIETRLIRDGNGPGTEGVRPDQLLLFGRYGSIYFYFGANLNLLIVPTLP